jgi:hypothetical protein
MGLLLAVTRLTVSGAALVWGGDSERSRTAVAAKPINSANAILHLPGYIVFPPVVNQWRGRASLPYAGSILLNKAGPTQTTAASAPLLGHTSSSGRDGLLCLSGQAATERLCSRTSLIPLLPPVYTCGNERSRSPLATCHFSLSPCHFPPGHFCFITWMCYTCAQHKKPLAGGARV